MLKVVGNLALTNEVGIMLALVPAGISLAIAFYAWTNLHRNLLSNLFSLLILAAFLWQINDVLLRMADTAETAEMFDKFFSTGWIMIIPLGLHFALVYTGRGWYFRNPQMFPVLYGPAILLDALYKIESHSYSYTSIWGWTNNREENLSEVILLAWCACLSVITAFILWQHVVKTRKNKLLFRQSFFIAAGFSIPVVQGVITEVFFPLVLEQPPMPVTSSFMVFFSIGVMISLSHYQLLFLSKTIHANKLLDQMQRLLLTVSTRKQLNYINAFGCRILGLNPELADQANWSQPAPAQNQIVNTVFSGVIDECFQKGKAGDKLLTITSATGELLTLLVNAELIYFKNRIRGVLIEGEDVTERIKADRQLKEQNTELQKINRELDHIVYSASHDIRAPLVSIVGLINLAEMETKDAVQLDYLKKIRQCVDRLDHYTLDIIHYSRNSRLEPEYKEVNLAQIVEEVFSIYKLDPKYSNLDLSVTIEGTEPFISDSGRLLNILTNLIGNAVKYRKTDIKDPYVQVNIKVDDKEAVVVVKDNGTGIQQRHLPYIFDMFYRAHEHSHGSGLGLYIVRETINRVGGEIQVQSEIGKGTVFSFRVPNRKEVKAPVQAAESPDMAPKLQIG